MKSLSLLILFSLAVGFSLHTGNAQEATPSPELARAMFEKLTQLNGSWIGKSSKGWEEKVTYSTIAAGTVVVEQSLDAHPNEQMLTLFHMDRDRLMLTHYCVSKTQPRLVATQIAPDRSEVLFTFLDATSLPTRDRGHMDKLRMQFLSDSTVVNQWTWYQDGKESWLEEITCERTR